MVDTENKQSEITKQKPVWFGVDDQKKHQELVEAGFTAHDLPTFVKLNFNNAVDELIRLKRKSEVAK